MGRFRFAATSEHSTTLRIAIAFDQVLIETISSHDRHVCALLASISDWRAAILEASSFLGILLPVPKYIFVGYLSKKRRMRHVGVVLVDVEGHQLANRRNRVERVQIQPLVLEYPPP